MSTATVLITGALTGIGRAAAIAFAQEGYRVAVSGRREDAGQSLAAELRGLRTDAEFIAADVRREEDVLGKPKMRFISRGKSQADENAFRNGASSESCVPHQLYYFSSELAVEPQFQGKARYGGHRLNSLAAKTTRPTTAA